MIFKSSFFAAAVLSICTVLSGCCTHQEQQKENVSLLIPEKIYAVPGVETNVYFNNVVTVINPDNYVFDVDCSKGRNDLKRWRFTPQKSDTGTYKWSIRVIGMNGVLARAEAELVVLHDRTLFHTFPPKELNLKGIIGDDTFDYHIGRTC